MKQYLIVLSILTFALISCSKTANDAVEVEDGIVFPAPLTAANEADEYYSADGVKLIIDMNAYSENAKLLTADDIYLLSYRCGYISDGHRGILVIEEQEQLDRALEQYGLALPPEGLTADELWHYDTAISEPFNKMIAEYPVSDYSYVIEYVQVSSGGYSFKVGALLVDEENLSFVSTEDSRIPDRLNELSQVMDGFCYMAAVPKGMLMNEHYERCTYP